MGVPCRHWNASANSGVFCSAPRTRKRGGEWLVDHHAAANLGLADFGAPRLANRHEELLVFIEAVGFLHGIGSLAQIAICAEGQLDAAHVGDVFAEGELAIEIQARQRFESTVVIDHGIGLSF